MAIEVFAELACPFTHFALRQIVDRRTERGLTTPPLRIRPWPLELVNGQPLDARHVATEVRAMRQQVSPDLFQGFDVGAFPSSSMGGFRLAAAADSVEVGLGVRVGLALRDALFEQGLDIGDPDVLAAIAATHGLDVAGPELDEAVRRSYAEGQRRDVVGSPHFFVDDTSAFCPLLDIRKDDAGELRITFHEVAATELVDRWLAGEVAGT
jgi:predicted DsbA family dithiol-disulfide isomerase